MTMKEEYTAIDMATAAADGFRAGQRAAQSAGVPEGYALVPINQFESVLNRNDWRTAANRAELRALLSSHAEGGKV